MEVEKINEMKVQGDANLVNSQISFGDQFNLTFNEAESLKSGITFKERQISESLDNEIVPRIESDVLSILRSKRVVIFQNNESVDMFDYENELANHILAHEDKGIFELFTNQNETSILPKLLSRENGGIYFLSNIDALHVDFNLPELIAIASQKEMYFIVSTGSSKNRWEMAGGTLSECWVDIDPDTLYDLELIKKKLHESLLKMDFIAEIHSSIGSDTLISKSISFGEITDKLARPLQLHLFLRRFEELNTIPTDVELKNILSEVGGHSEEIIQRWFGKLSHNQKLIAIAFTLFDGVYTSQFFEAINRFFSVEETSVWKVSAPELAAIDYKDLSFLAPFTHEEIIQGSERLISSRSDFRRVLFKTIWKTYRRHLMSVFPSLIGILSESYKHKTSNWELFGTKERRAKLRVSFVESISDLGLVQIDTAESILLDLAANGHFHLRGLVASSLAKWRAQDGDAKLFSVLKRWQEDESIMEIVHEKLSRRITSVSNSRLPNEAPVNLIKSTVAVTLSKAAEYDKRNELNEGLIQLFVQLAKDKSKLVRYTVNKSLPDFIHKHVFQLKSILFDELMQIEFYQDSIANGLLEATVENASEMREVILDWLKTCRNSSSNENRRIKGTYRDSVLMTILSLIRKVINENHSEELFTEEELFTIGLKFYAQEDRQVVRDSLIEMLADLTANYPEIGRNKISDIQKIFKGDDRRKFVRFMTLHYLNQRKNLNGGDVRFEFKQNQFISTWLDSSSRPLTSLEHSLIAWVNGGNMEAKRIATLVFLDIAGFVEEAESKFILAEKQRRIVEELAKKERERVSKMGVAPIHTVIGLGFWLRLRILFMLLFEPRENRLALKDVIQLIFNNKGHSLAHIRLMNMKWKKYDPNGLAGKLGTWLDRLL